MPTPRRPSVTGTTTLGLILIVVFSFLAPFTPLASGDDELVSLAREQERVLIADFGLGLCNQCRKQSEILTRIKEVYKGKILVRTVHVNREAALTSRYQVETIPHLVFIDPAGRIRFRGTGVMSFEEISAQLARMGVDP